MVDVHKAVDVLCLCSAEGEIRPLRMRMSEENQSVQAIEIEEILGVKEISYPGVEAVLYLCRGQLEGKPQRFELKYGCLNHRWTLRREIE